MVIASFLVSAYHNLLLAWALYYLLFASMQKHIPWDTCGNSWNSICKCSRIFRTIFLQYRTITLGIDHVMGMLLNGKSKCVDKILLVYREVNREVW